MFNQMVDIDRRIEDLQRLKEAYKPMQQPINIYNNANIPTNDFYARILDGNEKVDEILIQKKTAFIDFKNCKLIIKDINGDVKEYEILLPKTPEQIKIEELERKLEEYEQRYNNANNEEWKSTTNDNEQYESTTKTDSRDISKKRK